VRCRAPKLPGQAARAVQGDLAGTARELLKHGRARARGEGERSACVAGREGDGLLDEEAAGGSGGRARPDDRAEAALGTAAAVRRHQAGAEVEREVPRRRVRLGPLGGDPAGVTVRAAREPDADPRPPATVGRLGEHRQHGSHTRQRAPRPDQLDASRVSIWRAPGDVVGRERDERLGGRHRVGGARGRGEREEADNGRDHRAAACASAHPVNREGPLRGRSRAAAHTR
jgi:hypothetical protein